MPGTLIDQLRERANNRWMSSDRAANFPSTPGACLGESEILGVERQLGFSIPPLLREAYLHVGNGGWGPGCGLLRLTDLAESNRGESASGLYQIFMSGDPHDPAWHWPRFLLPICDWGCAIRSCVECETESYQVFTFDPGALQDGDPTANAIAPTGLTLREWLEAWLSGVDLWSQMFEPDPDRAMTVINPFTKKPVTHVPMRLRRAPV